MSRTSKYISRKMLGFIVQIVALEKAHRPREQNSLPFSAATLNFRVKRTWNDLRELVKKMLRASRGYLGKRLVTGETLFLRSTCSFLAMASLLPACPVYGADDE